MKKEKLYIPLTSGTDEDIQIKRDYYNLLYLNNIQKGIDTYCSDIVIYKDVTEILNEISNIVKSAELEFPDIEFEPIIINNIYIENNPI